MIAGICVDVGYFNLVVVVVVVLLVTTAVLADGFWRLNWRWSTDYLLVVHTILQPTMIR